MSDVYLDPAAAGVRWLLNPDSVLLGELAREAETRTPDSTCDVAALAHDAPALAALLHERHFGVATSLVPRRAVDEVVAAWERLLASRPRTWRAAVTDLQLDLREALVDEHVRIAGAPAWRDGRSEREEEGPAVEESEVDGVLVVRIRRLIGGTGDEALLARWSADADRHFGFERIVVDLRGNEGGNDGHTFSWVERRLRPVPLFVREWGWQVRGAPLGSWNAAAWRAARDGADAVPPHLASGRHEPRPDDRIELVEREWPLDAGPAPWDGRMVVLVDTRTRSSGESSAWLLRAGLGATLAGDRTAGMIEYGNIVPYVLPRSRLVVHLPTKRNDYGFRVESVGFPVDVPLSADVSAAEVAAGFDAFVRR